MKNSSSEELMKECMIFNSAKNFNEILNKKLKSNLKKNLKFHDRRGSDIFVDTRFQYTPIQIINLLKKYKFQPISLSPIHIHVFPTNSKKYLPKVHDYVSNYIQNQKNIPIQFITQSSSFSIAAKKQ